MISHAVNSDTGEDYAFEMHEFQLSTMTPNPKYGLGPLTAMQPSTPEGGAGGKYIERVLTHGPNLLVYSALLVKMLEAASRGKDPIAEASMLGE